MPSDDKYPAKHCHSIPSAAHMLLQRSPRPLESPQAAEALLGSSTRLVTGDGSATSFILVWCGASIPCSSADMRINRSASTAGAGAWGVTSVPTSTATGVTTTGERAYSPPARYSPKDRYSPEPLEELEKRRSVRSPSPARRDAECRCAHCRFPSCTGLLLDTRAELGFNQWNGHVPVLHMISGCELFHELAPMYERNPSLS